MKLNKILIIFLFSCSVFAQEDLQFDGPPDLTIGEVDTADTSNHTHCFKLDPVGNFSDFEVVGETINSAYNALESASEDLAPFIGGSFPNNCDPNARGTYYQYVRYGIAMARGYFCKKLRPRKFLNYGCFCGSSNAGLNTNPSDGVDLACRQHDHNLWAICQNAQYNNPDGRPCNCYENTPMPKCSNGEIVRPKGLSACESACLEDVIELSSTTKKNMASYSSSRHHYWTSFTGGDMSATLPYCSNYSQGLPPNRFGSISPEPILMRGP